MAGRAWPCRSVCRSGIGNSAFGIRHQASSIGARKNRRTQRPQRKPVLLSVLRVRMRLPGRRSPESPSSEGWAFAFHVSDRGVQLMCGIAGFVESPTSSSPLDREAQQLLIQRMCDVIRHRGPDDQGVFLADGIALGMRRLSIIDLSTGHQPIHNEDRSIWIVFNGEIYNFMDLRAELEAAGHRFYTSTDTET